MVLLVAVNLLFAAPIIAQSPNGTISGIVHDPSGAVIAGAEIIIVNDATGVQSSTTTNSEGIYVVPSLLPGAYRVQVSKIGFKTLIKPDIILHVQDAFAINFTLPIGAASETVTVRGGAPLINTESGAVSTVINRNLVETLPLNGRSFNTLLQLTPGVVIAQATSGVSSQGQFSVAGQRTSANNFTVDGVSANFGVAPTIGIGTSGTGAAQAFSALGSTSSLVSIEALQEFRIDTSSFAPEFGRSPGGQVMLTTRSGTNNLHGGIYEYFRNEVLDANDWFANQAGKSRAPERHNDFGLFLGGPVQRDKAFFFLSYEGTRLRQPNTAVVEVPSEYARTAASNQTAPFLDAYPQPDDRTITPAIYTGTFTGNYSNPSTLDAGSIRIDRNFGTGFSLFGRFNQAPSATAVRSGPLNEVDTVDVGTTTLTVGATMALSPRILNSLRWNYSLQTSSLVSRLDSFGGAVPPSLSILGPSLPNPNDANLGFFTIDTGHSYQTGPQSRNRATQLNLADDLSLTHGTHQLKFGADYRAIFLNLTPYQAEILYLVSSVPNFLSNGQADIGVASQSTKPSQFLVQSTSLYGQDTWKITPRLTLTYGLRWELSPAPAARGKTTLAAWTNVDTPSEIGLAPFGTQLWNTTYTNFAPRLGVAYSLTPQGDFVVRGGLGVFYDLGSDSVGYLQASFPNDWSSCCRAASLPLSDATLYLPQTSLSPPYPSLIYAFAPGLMLPRSYQWNVAIEKSLKGNQTLSLTYVGQAGRSLLRQEGLSRPNANFPGAFILTRNDAQSNYDALEAQYRRPLSGRLEGLLSYTWSHSLDNASNDTVEAVSNTVLSSASDYASSGFDVRNSFSGALTYNIPALGSYKPLATATRNWSIGALVVARGGFPFNAVVPQAILAGVDPRPNLVTGQPLWILNPTAGGGKSLNPAAFTIPPPGKQGTEGRNNIPGFGLTEFDLSLGRKFPISERLDIQFRIDAFNILNHPNFTNPVGFVGIPAYMSSLSMLNHGLGGLNSLFQEGGPRSLQLSLKLSF
ncbi:MAG: TonB-dependent receptor [Candidatus Acidiferrales bacterium]